MHGCFYFGGAYFTHDIQTYKISYQELPQNRDYQGIFIKNAIKGLTNTTYDCITPTKTNKISKNSLYNKTGNYFLNIGDVFIKIENFYPLLK